MSRKFALLAAAFAFSALVAAGSTAHAQAQSDMIPPGGSLPGGSTAGAPMGGAAMSGTALGRPAVPGSAMRGSTASTGAMQPRREMRRGRPAMRRQMRADRRAAQNPDAAYMGGGAVYERAADGSLRPVM